MKTSEIINDLESLTKLAMSVSEKTQGRSPEPWATMMSSIAFSRLVLNSISILRLTPGSTFCSPVGELQIWDLPSVASLSRNLVDAYFVLSYLVNSLPAEQSELRELVWNYHAASERFKMLQHGFPQSQGLPSLNKKVNDFKASIESHLAFKPLSKKQRSLILKGDSSKIHENVEILQNSGVDSGYYNSIFKYGSNHTHTSPFSLMEMDSFNAKEDRSRDKGVLWMSLQMCAGFLSVAILNYVVLFPDQDKNISFEERLKLSFWEQILKKGPASLVPKPGS